MTEQQYKDLLIATAKMSDYEHKDEVVEALKVASVSFQKEWAFTYHLPDHRQEYIIISVVPDKLIVLKEHEDFVDDFNEDIDNIGVIFFLTTKDNASDDDEIVKGYIV